MRRFLAPEVIQTSAMDCGPACLKSVLEGHGIHASYGRLREACQTEIDGTSIDVIGDVAVALGLDAEQILVPLDHLLLPQADALPAIVIVRLPAGDTHFVVLWRVVGPFVQVMDPAQGRRWIRKEDLERTIHVHEARVPVAAWREWTASAEFLRPFRARLDRLRVSASTAETLCAGVPIAPDWQAVADLDAAVRMVDALAAAGAVARGAEAERLLRAVVRQPQLIPSSDRLARSAESEDLFARGAVLVRVRGPGRRADALPPELEAALSEAPPRPVRALLDLMLADGRGVLAALLGASVLAAVGLTLEAVLFRALLDLGHDVALVEERLAASAALAVFLLLLLALEAPIASGLLSVGRRLEVRLRAAFLAKLPRLQDRYFTSRPVSDMGTRSHLVHVVRELPGVAALAIRLVAQIALTGAAILWLDPATAPLVVAAAGLAIAIPAFAQPVLTEREMGIQVHEGALGRFNLDVLLGLMAVRTHAAERSVRREQERLLGDWMGAGRRLVRARVASDGLQWAGGLGLAAWLVLSHVGRGHESGQLLLLAYWALSLPFLGSELGAIAAQLPTHRNRTLRLLEPLGAPEVGAAEVGEAEAAGEAASTAVSISMVDVTVRAGGHIILEGVDLEIPPGSQVAIIGASGAGKSSLVGLLLGWHSPARGKVSVDGEPLTQSRLAGLRRRTAWVDPSVQLWNAPLLENLAYGNGALESLAEVVAEADLRPLLETFPEGFQTPLGEGGARVSGGQGQRVRFGRALLRRGVGLAILDEPFRGLERSRRHALLARARRLWRGATVLCITHDVGETVDFDLVLVVEGGRVVERGRPGVLAASSDSRYRAALDAEEHAHAVAWSAPGWRRMRLDDGRLIAEREEQS